jgi:hypothetical protein
MCQESHKVDYGRWHHRGVQCSNTSRASQSVNKVQGTALNEIGIAREYPDAFPEELPGMPPDRDIEFMIELLSDAPYL